MIIANLCFSSSHYRSDRPPSRPPVRSPVRVGLSGRRSLVGSQSVSASRYLWTIPNDVNENCVLRVRYNITSTDYTAWKDLPDSATAVSVGVGGDSQSCKIGAATALT